MAKKEQTLSLTERRAKAQSKLDELNAQISASKSEVDKLVAARDAARGQSLDAFERASDALEAGERAHARRCDFLNAQMAEHRQSLADCDGEERREELARAKQEMLDADDVLNSAAERLAAAVCEAHAAKLEIDEAAERVEGARAHLASKSVAAGDTLPATRSTKPHKIALARVQAAVFTQAPRAFLTPEWLLRFKSIEECVAAVRESLGYATCNEFVRFPLDAQLEAMFDGTYTEKVDAINRDHSATFAANRERIALAEKEQQSFTKRAITALTGIVRA